MKKLLLFLGFFICCVHISVFAQDDSTKAIPKYQFGGYIKFLETQSFDHLSNTHSATHLLHNRLRLKWNPSTQWTLQAEVRNRIFWGSGVQNNPFFARYLRNQNEWLLLSDAWINQSNLVAHTVIDRFYVDWKWEKITFRLGRQRINWGIASIWNPNDLFNAYNFLDIDYEERPGSDAIKGKYNFENLSTLEVVYAQTSKKNAIYAAKYFFNTSNIDYQLIAGNYQGAATLGIGFAGNLGDGGLKAEFQHYFKRDILSPSQTNFTMGYEYMFSKGWFLSAGYLLNSLGLVEPISNFNTIDFRLSSKNLMPTKHNVLFTASKQVGPLSSLALTTIYAPKTNLMIAVPTFTYSISNNMEGNIFLQSFFADLQANFKAVSTIVLARLRWSF